MIGKGGSRTVGDPDQGGQLIIALHAIGLIPIHPISQPMVGIGDLRGRSMLPLGAEEGKLHPCQAFHQGNIRGITVTDAIGKDPHQNIAVFLKLALNG